MMTTLKLFPTFVFSNLLNQCSEIAKVGAITQALNSVMADYLKLDLIGYDGYDFESVRHADEDLIKAIYNMPSFPFLDSFRLSDGLMAFEDILASPINKYEDHQWVRDEGLTSTLDPLQPGLVLATQPLGHFEEPPIEEPPLLEPKPKKKVGNTEAVANTGAKIATGIPTEEVSGQTGDTTAMEVDVTAMRSLPTPLYKKERLKLEEPPKHWTRSSQTQTQACLRLAPRRFLPKFLSDLLICVS